MKLFVNPTSPYVRIVRMAIVEKGLAGEIELVPVDAWADAPDFLDANPAGRVPALVTEDGTRICEAFLILHYLDGSRPQTPVLPAGPDAARVLSRAGLAVAIFDAAVEVVIARKSAPDFDGHMVGRKRFRTMRDGLARLDREWPEGGTEGLDFAGMAAVTALDYLVFRFTDEDWRGIAPRIAAFRDAQADRASVKGTAPA